MDKKQQNKNNKTKTTKQKQYNCVNKMEYLHNYIFLTLSR